MRIQILVAFLLSWFIALPALAQQTAGASADQGSASSSAQATVPTTASASQPLPNPSMTAPLQTAAPPHMSSSGSPTNPAALNLLGYGPGSGAFSFTATPTYQKKGSFIRGDFSIVHATSSTAGDVFGPLGLNVNQPRGALEAGFMF